jgi:mono/diheme cytochrome c family protein
MRSTKHQSPSTREAPNSNNQGACNTVLGLGAWSFFGIWCLGFGASRKRLAGVIGCLIICAFASCRPDMNNQPKAKPFSQSDFFQNGSSARQLPPYTVAYGDTREDAAFYTGLTNGTYLTRLPVKLTPELLNRGREQYNAICAECHDRSGSGNGMVVQRGFPEPPSYHVDRLRNAAIGHFYDVITNGYGVMYSYADRVAPEDRWAIAAYLRALQLSHNAKLSDADPAERAKLASGRVRPNGGLEGGK